MKKQYSAPQLDVVTLDTRDLIATSTRSLGFGSGGGTGSVGAPDRDDWSLEDW